MFGDKLNFFKTKGEDKPNDKKKMENLIVFGIILIITIIAINVIWNDDKKSNSKENVDVPSGQLASKQNTTSENSTNVDLETKLKNILQKIQGVGKVEVFVNYSESSETVAMYNENSKVSSTEETDTSGGKRVIEQTDTQKDIIYKEDDGQKVPITQKIIQPKIEGAIITAEGAGNANIKANIVQAVEAATGLATHKIQVFEMQT
ncbi:MAG: hypothetical protein IKF38_00790 [Clostridia bacterium]|nr:hypothetical protein [Clostridia bacterium]